MPNLYKLARRKNNMVADDLENQWWTRGLWRMVSAEKMVEFVILWGKLQDVFLTDGEDSISGIWTAHGVYTSKSTYEV